MILRRLALAVFAALLALPAAGEPKLKVYISADMEGVAGVVTGDQLSPTAFEYERFRGFMTNEVLAAIDGARAAGATEILVSDSHGNGENLLIERFPRDVQVVRAWPPPLAMMQGIDGSFDAVFFVGYHSSATDPEGVRAHTMSSANLADVRLGGVSVPEAGLNAAIAGHFRDPVPRVRPELRAGAVAIESVTPSDRCTDPTTHRGSAAARHRDHFFSKRTRYCPYPAFSRSSAGMNHMAAEFMQ